jgi:hypothetical protein
MTDYLLTVDGNLTARYYAESGKIYRYDGVRLMSSDDEYWTAVRFLSLPGHAVK